MLIVIALSLSIGQTIDCENHKQIDVMPINITADEWPQTICNNLKSYKNVSLRVLHVSKTKIKENYLDYGTGQYQIGKMQAGRIKFKWYSDKGNHNIVAHFKVDAYKNVWVFRKHLNPFHEITSYDVKRSIENVARYKSINDTYVFSPVGKYTTHRVYKNQVVTEKLLTDPPLVTRNQTVRLVLKNGNGLTLKATGKALNTAWKKGDSVTVLVNKKRHKIVAQVEKRGIAYVHM